MSTPGDELRYAVLHHTHVAHPHYDLLLEVSPEAPLATWRCDTWPGTSGAVVERLADHRRMYLDYEGLISGGRGEVHRVGSGTLKLLQADDNTVRAQLSGVGTVWLQRVDGSRWSLTLE